MAKHCMFCGEELVDGLTYCIVCGEAITWAEKDIPDEKFDINSDDWHEPVSDPDSVTYNYYDSQPDPAPRPDPAPASKPKPEPERTTNDFSDQTYHPSSYTPSSSGASGSSSRSSGGGKGCLGILAVVAIVVALFNSCNIACSAFKSSSTKVSVGTAEELVREARRDGYGSVYNEQHVLDTTIIDNDRVTVAILGTGEYTVDGKTCAGLAGVVRANQPARLAFLVTNVRVGDIALDDKGSYEDVKPEKMSAGEYKLIGWGDETNTLSTYQGGSATLTVIDKDTKEVLGSADFTM